MGALTLKSFPFELRGWDIEKFEGIDPTDGFGSNTRVYTSKNQIVQIEPDYDSQTLNNWLTDKGRQFFDGIFNSLDIEKDPSITKENSWINITKKLTQILYIFDHCNKHNNNKKKFTIVFENLSLEALSFLTIILQNYSFVRLRRAENFKLNNDLESNFQLTSSTNKIKLNLSTLCILISNNPRYEGYYLNLNLRQRLLKGNFKCLSVGSLINLTFPVKFLGSNTNIIKTISEGNHLICQDLKSSKNPTLIINNELFKRGDSSNIIKMLNILKYTGIFNKAWNGFNTLNSSLSETGLHSLNKFLPLSIKDLNNFSSIYFLNINSNNVINLKKITESKLLNFSTSNENTNNNLLFINQNNKDTNHIFYDKLNFLKNNCHHITSSMFYENEETFISTDGLIKRTTKLIFKRKTKNNWQILRKVFKNLKNNLELLNEKDTNIIYFNSIKMSNFKNFISFQNYATQSLVNLNYHLNTQNNSFIMNNNNTAFKPTNTKVVNSKLKYWLDDFFSGGRDEYSQNSLTMANCSIILRSNSSNFF